MTRREPLNQEEAALARTLSSLPRVAPPEALDQQILQAARQAVGPRRRRSWHWAGAAAAALALMVGAPLWRAPLETSLPTMEIGNATRTVPARKQAAEVESQVAAEQAEVKADVADADAGFGDSARMRELAPAAAPAAPAPPPPSAESAPSRDAERSERRQAPPAAAKSEPAPATESLREDMLLEQTIDQTGSALTPEQRLAQIAALKEEGRDAEARQALRELLQAHPGLEIPEALRELLQEPGH